MITGPVEPESEGTVPIDQSEMQTLDALGIGVAVRDITVRLDPFPDADAKVRARDLAESGGGPIPTALVTLARLGRACALAGVVPDDATGRFIVEGLHREGVDTTGVVRRADSASTSVILVESDGRRRVCEWRQSDLPYGPEDLMHVAPMLDRSRFLLIDSRLPDVQMEAARRVRHAGGMVVLDCGHPRPGVDEILRQCDIAIFSHSYPRSLHGNGFDATGFVRELRGKMAPDGRRIAGLTLGEDGCLIAEGTGDPTHVPGHRVEAVDTTGAGDVFHGAFVHELLGGASALDAARFANTAAALKCRGLTGRAPLPEEQEIRRIAAHIDGEKP